MYLVRISESMGGSLYSINKDTGSIEVSLSRGGTSKDFRLDLVEPDYTNWAHFIVEWDLSYRCGFDQKEWIMLKQRS